MKKILTSLLITFLVNLLLPSTARADFYQDITKDYCANINTSSATVGNDKVNLILGMDSTPSQQTDSRFESEKLGLTINQVIIRHSGGGMSQSFLSNQFISGPQISGSLVSINTGRFFKDALQNVTSGAKFDIDITKTITYSDDSKIGTTPRRTSCTTSKPQVLVLSQQQVQQQLNPANNPGVGNAAPANAFNPLGCPNGKQGIDTAIGCVPIGDSGETISWFLGWFIGISGGIAFLMIVFSGFQMMTATGDPQKLSSAREMLTAAISGLILIIFSVFLLNLIGVQILKLPGF